MQFEEVSVGDFLPLGNVLAKLFHLVYLLPPYVFIWGAFDAQKNRTHSSFLCNEIYTSV